MTRFRPTWPGCRRRLGAVTWHMWRSVLLRHLWGRMGTLGLGARLPTPELGAVEAGVAKQIVA